ncbi:metallophosphoesterase family protein [Methylomonas rapida]|uniref:Metallophosphatase domain-containing protein n=1 Tax=Methylomonas rapida TaxID=2963939 RepID=A0ABY7GRQ3_9GAMM|nr:metallophosphatase domain-containing protein [Methylomonas rapida]WAR47104.1 metallophosphatase domain-containing protein [Methylomonas rapida]
MVCLSDFHGRKIRFSIPSGNVLVVAGDICNRGNLEEIERFDRFLADLPHEHKLVVAGNHDWPFAKLPVENASSLLRNGIYLQDSSVTIDGVKFWGSPWQRKYFDGAFDLNRQQDLVEKWNKIPKDTDVLITHTPPYGTLDKTRRGNHAGCRDLAKIVQTINLKAHIFGHIHEHAGKQRVSGCIFVNASIAKHYHNKAYALTTIDID